MVLHGKSYLQLSSKMLYVSVGFLKYKWKISFNKNVYIHYGNLPSSQIYIFMMLNRIPLIYSLSKMHFYQKHYKVSLILKNSNTNNLFVYQQHILIILIQNVKLFTLRISYFIIVNTNICSHLTPLKSQCVFQPLAASDTAATACSCARYCYVAGPTATRALFVLFILISI